MRTISYLALALAILLTAQPRNVAADEEAVGLDGLAVYYGMAYDPGVSNAPPTLRSSYSTAVFTPGSRRLLYNGTLVWLNAGTTGTGTQARISRADFDTVLEPILRARHILTNLQVRTVVLDPGHGGTDPGAVRGGLVEKKLAREIAVRTKKKLRRAGFRVRMTRSWDSFRSLEKRTELAAGWDADLFVSIHLNAAANRVAAGIETYVLSVPGYASTSSSTPDSRRFPGNEWNAANMALGHRIHSSLLARTDAEDRGIKHARFSVLRTAPCPAVLVECGFLSNAEEAELLDSRSYRDRVADGIARGVIAFAYATEAANR